MLVTDFRSYSKNSKTVHKPSEIRCILTKSSLKQGKLKIQNKPNNLNGLSQHQSLERLPVQDSSAKIPPPKSLNPGRPEQEENSLRFL